MSIEFMKEGLDSYPSVVKQIDSNHRIIRCSDDTQYISQIRVDGKSQYPWRSESFYTTVAGARKVKLSGRLTSLITNRQSYPYREAALLFFVVPQATTSCLSEGKHFETLQ